MIHDSMLSYCWESVRKLFDDERVIGVFTFLPSPTMRPFSIVLPEWYFRFMFGVQNDSMMFVRTTYYLAGNWINEALDAFFSPSRPACAAC